MHSWVDSTPGTENHLGMDSHRKCIVNLVWRLGNAACTLKLFGSGDRRYHVLRVPSIVHRCLYSNVTYKIKLLVAYTAKNCADSGTIQTDVGNPFPQSTASLFFGSVYMCPNGAKSGHNGCFPCAGCLFTHWTANPDGDPVGVRYDGKSGSHESISEGKSSAIGGATAPCTEEVVIFSGRQAVRAVMAGSSGLRGSCSQLDLGCSSA